MQEPLENTGRGIQLLKNAGKDVVFVTNNSVRSLDNYREKFNEAKIHVDLNKDIVHPVKTIIEYLKSMQFEGLIYCVAAKTFKDALKNAGFDIIDGPNKIIEESFVDLAENIFDKHPVKAVIIDVDYNLSAPKLMKAHLYLKGNQECLFIGGAANMVIPFRNTEIIGPGPYIQIVENTVGRKAVILGKPGKELGEVLKKNYNILESRRAIFIGDSLENDVGFGKKCGFQTLVVLTGATKRDDLNNYKYIDVLPNYYADSLSDFECFFKDIEI